MSDRQLVESAEYEELIAIGIVGPVLHAGILREVGGTVVERPRPGIAGEELEPVGITLLDRSLQGVIAGAGRGGDGVDVLIAASGQSDVIVEGPTLVAAADCSRRIGGATAASAAVRSRGLSFGSTGTLSNT